MHVGCWSPAPMLGVQEQDEELEAVAVRDTTNTGTERLDQRGRETLERTEYWLTTGQRWVGTAEGPVFYGRRRGKQA